MAKKLLPRASTTVTIGGTAYTDQITSFVVNSTTEMTRAETFATEGKQDQEPGSEGLAINVAGFLAYDAAATFIPIPAPQNTAYVFTFFTACTLTVTADCVNAVMGAVVGQLRFFTMTLLSKATPSWTVAWDVS